MALLSRNAPLALHKGFEGDDEDSQKRFIWGTYADSNGQPVTIMNGYFPQGESRDHPTKFPAKQRFTKTCKRCSRANSATINR